MIKTSEITPEYLEQNLNASSSIIIIPILSDRYIHWSNKSSTLSCMYIHFIDINESCMIGLNHFDLDEFDINVLYSILNNSDSIKYIYNKSYVSNCIHRSYVIDLDIYLWFNYSINLEPISTQLVNVDNLYAEWYNAYPNFNNIIPISHHMQVCKEIINSSLKYIDKYTPTEFSDLYIQLYQSVCSNIESVGICLDPELTEEKYGVKLNDRIIHPVSNIKTLTGRPSFKYDRISFNSMRKDDNYRNIIISRFGQDGTLFEYDYDGYHVRLIASLIGYKFDLDENVHEHLGKYYFGIDKLNTEQYEQSKRITFKQLYGEVETTYSYIDFFKQVEIYKNEMWNNFERDGYATTSCGRKFESSKLVEMTRGKLFSYLQQAAETEQNIKSLQKIQTYLYPYSSKLILYTYDAFLIDYDNTDDSNILVEIQKILEQSGYPVKIKFGKKYGDMNSVVGKLKNNSAA